MMLQAVQHRMYWKANGRRGLTSAAVDLFRREE